MIPLLTEAEAAEALGLSARTLRKLRAGGSIRYVALTARRVAYRPQDLEAYVAGRVQMAAPATTQPPRAQRKPRHNARVIPFTARPDVR